MLREPNVGRRDGRRRYEVAARCKDRSAGADGGNQLQPLWQCGALSPTISAEDEPLALPILSCSATQK